MKTAMQELRWLIQNMTENGGDYDLLCVLGLIDDSFMNKEKQQIINAHESGQNIVDLGSYFTDSKTYYEETFK